MPLPGQPLRKLGFLTIGLFDEREASAPIDSGDDHGDELRDARAHLGGEHEGTSAGVKEESAGRLVDVAIGQRFSVCASVE